MEFENMNTDKELTLFYSKSTGKVKYYCTGIQTMDYFGEDKEDYNYNVLVVENDSFITQHLDDFVVENNELIYNAPKQYAKYRR